MHSNQQISWVNEVMHTQQNPISDTFDCHSLGAGEVHVPIQPHFKDPKKKIQNVTAAKKIHLKDDLRKHF